MGEVLQIQTERKVECMETSLFQKKLTQYKDMVYRIAYTYLRNQADAEDIDFVNNTWHIFHEWFQAAISAYS